MKKIKIYIHHYYHNYNNSLKFFHNIKNRVTNINENGIGNIIGEYKDHLFEFIFNPEMHNNDDGVHLLDFFSAHQQKDEDERFSDIEFYNNVEDAGIIKRFSKLIKHKEKWILTIYRTEKIFNTKTDVYIQEIESVLRNLKNHYVVSDNLFIKDLPSNDYLNFYYTFTNSIFEWKHLINIHYSYIFKNVFEKLNFDYNLGYSVRAHRPYRVELLNKLSKLNNPKLFLSRTNSIQDEEKNLFYLKVKINQNINQNLIKGNFDFESIDDVFQNRGPGFDMYFKILNKSKMFLLDESWSWSKGEFVSQYLSEKTINLVLANIPFISTHSYPLDFLQKVFQIPKHPFYNEIKNSQGDPDKITEFVKNFLDNFDKNYPLCKEWSDGLHNLCVERLKTENSLLDLIISDFKQETVLSESKLF